MTGNFRLDSYDYHLPAEQVAQFPEEQRDSSRLLVLERESHSIIHDTFSSILKYLNKDDCLVLNNSKVFPARLLGRKSSGGKVEIFLLHYPEKTDTPGLARGLALYRSSKPLKTGQAIYIGQELKLTILGRKENGQVELELTYSGSLQDALEKAGKMPLPPYIKREADSSDVTRYQTVYAASTGSVAAPTAGLHFTRKLLEKIRAKGVHIAYLTLHVGYGTFAPIRTNDIRDHKIHSEWVEINAASAETIKLARRGGGRIIAVGTTSVRTLEYVAHKRGDIMQFSGNCDLYIMPGHRFRAIDAMITNFHLPRSSLLVLVSAFAGRQTILATYREAIEKGYRFYSYGDAMLIK